MGINKIRKIELGRQEITSNLEYITPDLASRYLMFNNGNRTIRKRLVEKYASDMKSGKWQITHQGIAFNIKGDLLDGQHRLSAIIQSGEAVPMMVSRGIDQEKITGYMVDQGTQRDASDILSLGRNEVSSIRTIYQLATAHRKTCSTAKIWEIHEIIKSESIYLLMKQSYLGNSHIKMTSSAVLSSALISGFMSNPENVYEKLNRIRYADFKGFNNYDTAVYKKLHSKTVKGANQKSETMQYLIPYFTRLANYSQAKTSKEVYKKAISVCKRISGITDD